MNLKSAEAQGAELIFDNGSFVLLIPIHFFPRTHLSPCKGAQNSLKSALMHIKQKKEKEREEKSWALWQEQTMKHTHFKTRTVYSVAS